MTIATTNKLEVTVVSEAIEREISISSLPNMPEIPYAEWFKQEKGNSQYDRAVLDPVSATVTQRVDNDHSETKLRICFDTSYYDHRGKHKNWNGPRSTSCYYAYADNKGYVFSALDEWRDAVQGLIKELFAQVGIDYKPERMTAFGYPRDQTWDCNRCPFTQKSTRRGFYIEVTVNYK